MPLKELPRQKDGRANECGGEQLPELASLWRWPIGRSNDNNADSSCSSGELTKKEMDKAANQQHGDRNRQTIAHIVAQRCAQRGPQMLFGKKRHLHGIYRGGILNSLIRKVAVGSLRNYWPAEHTHSKKDVEQSRPFAANSLLHYPERRHLMRMLKAGPFAFRG